MFLIISISSNSQKLTTFDQSELRLLYTIQLIFELLSLPIKNNYCFLKKKNTYSTRIRNLIFYIARLYFRFIDCDRSFAILFKGSGSHPTEKSRTTYIYRHVYICTYVCMCVCETLAYRYYFIVFWLLPFFFFFFMRVRIRTYNRYKYKSQANIS